MEANALAHCGHKSRQCDAFVDISRGERLRRDNEIYTSRNEVMY